MNKCFISLFFYTVKRFKHYLFLLLGIIFTASFTILIIINNFKSPISLPPQTILLRILNNKEELRDIILSNNNLWRLIDIITTKLPSSTSATKYLLASSREKDFILASAPLQAFSHIPYAKNRIERPEQIETNIIELNHQASYLKKEIDDLMTQAEADPEKYRTVTIHSKRSAPSIDTNLTASELANLFGITRSEALRAKAGLLTEYYTHTKTITIHDDINAKKSEYDSIYYSIARANAELRLNKRDTIREDIIKYVKDNLNTALRHAYNIDKWNPTTPVDGKIHLRRSEIALTEKDNLGTNTVYIYMHDQPPISIWDYIQKNTKKSDMNSGLEPMEKNQ